jgi:hypothetical protein
VAHIAICATNARCATSQKKYAPLRFENSKKNQFFFENHKNQNNMKKLLYFNFLRILSHEEYFQITPNFLTSR